MASYNANGIEQRRDVLLSLVEMGVDVVAIQESHVLREGRIPLLPEFVAYRAEDTIEPKRGMITYIRADISRYTFIYKRKRGSELWLLCKGYPFSESKPGLIINVHWKTKTEGELVKTVKRLHKHSKKYPMLILGDFNIHPPDTMHWQLPWWGDSTSKLGRVVQAANGVIGQYRSDPRTHMDIRGSSTIDYVVGPGEWSHFLEETKVEFLLQGSDHCPIKATWRLNGDKPIDKPRRLLRKELSQAADVILETSWRTPCDSLDDLTNLVTKSLQEVAPRTSARKNRRFWSSGATIQFWRRRMVKAWADFQRSGRHNVRARQSWIEAKKRLRIVCTDARYDEWLRLMESLPQMGKTDSKRLFSFGKGMGGNVQRRAGCIRVVNTDGTLMEKEQATAAILEHLLQVMSPRPEHTELFEQNLRSEAARSQTSSEWTTLRRLAEWGEVLDPITQYDIGKTIAGMNMGTSPGTDRIPMAIWKQVCSEERMRQLLASLFNSILESGKFPDSWIEVRCVLIPKTENPREAKDYRAIMITQTLYRIFTKTLQTKFRKTIESKGWFQQEQVGFRACRSTIDQVTTLMEILERRKKEKLETCLVFIDLKQAYDSVHNEALKTALVTMGLPERFVKVLVDLYKVSRVKIDIMGTERELVATCGLRQGCPLAPLLFIILINRLIEKLREGPRLEIPGISREQWSFNSGRLLNSLWFADDGVLMANTEIGAQEMLEILDTWTTEWGLQVNASKSAGMKVTRRRKGLARQLSYKGQVIPEVRSYVYLGCLVSRSASRQDMAKHRMTETKKVVKWLEVMLRRLWMAPLVVKTRLCKAFLEGSCLYGSEIWCFGKAESLVNNMLGRIARVIWGAPRTGNLVVYAMEAGFVNAGLMTLVKRLRLLYRAIKNGESPLLMLGHSYAKIPALLGDMMNSTRQLSTNLQDQMRLIRNQYKEGEWMALERGWINGRKEVLQSTAAYMKDFWGRNSLRNLGGSAAERSLFHALRMDSFFDWRRVAWSLGRHDTEQCGWCRQRVRETRAHLLLTCSAWNYARSRLLGSVINKLRWSKFSDAELMVVMLGGEARERQLKQEEGMKIGCFLRVVQKAREAMLKTMKRQIK